MKGELIMKNRQKSKFLTVAIPVMRAFRTVIVGEPQAALFLVLLAICGAIIALEPMLRRVMV